eukprot:TRINITY_DN6497_c0_g1_i2.p1 TRINITY_DN6497_c0_g1~~TRINITY_DN6497_c0_g1_i2.p1  ORF type:complete len:279 (+),score=74.90 TRINITY_DN6497_c0_g1_i2:66-902(+)
MIRRPPRSTQSRSSAASDVYKRQRQDTAALVPDDTPFWHLAEGEAAFSVTVIHLHSEVGSLPVMDSPVTLYVQHESTGISAAVTMPLKSTLLQLKIATFDKLALGDANAALDPRVGFTFKGSLLDNEATIHSAQLSDGDRVCISERRSPCGSRRSSCYNSRDSSPAGTSQHSLIVDIWASSDSSDEEFALPSALLHEEPRSCRVGPHLQKYNNELERMKLSYRTKMCRAGIASCKYGHSCWFAHTPDELRKPSDPLPAKCPGVSKLEKYAKRLECCDP